MGPTVQDLELWAWVCHLEIRAAFRVYRAWGLGGLGFRGFRFGEVTGL